MNTVSNIFIPYEDFVNLQQDSAKLTSIISIINTEFPDDTCQIIANKSVLGIVDEEEEHEVPDDPSTEPTDQEPTDPPTDPVDPSTP